MSEANAKRPLAGKCLCGAVQYEVADEFRYALNCHCSDCRRATGSAFKPFAGIPRNKLHLGEATENVLIFGNPAGNHDVHCKICGSLLFSVVGEGKSAHVTLGTLLDPPTIRPTAHIFVADKAPWFEITDDLPQYEGHQSPPDGRKQGQNRNRSDSFPLAMNESISLCPPADVPAIFEIINDSARAYRGVIPADRWHEPYMPMAELLSEIGKGVRFYGFYLDGSLAGVMGIQDVKDVTLIRHAYVRTEFRSHGIGRKLLAHLNGLAFRPVLIGTWKAATWAIRFYEKNGFTLLGESEKKRLLKIYWTVPDRQIEESIVLADQRWFDHAKEPRS